MKPGSAATVVFSDDGRSILMQKRRDLPVWGIPGGTIEPGEEGEDTAIRETREETGYLVAIDRLVGTYSSDQLRNCKQVFAAHVIGGDAIRRGQETAAVGWFPVDHLPLNLIPWHRPYVQDALSGGLQPVERAEQLPGWQVLLYRLLFFARHRLKLPH